MLPAIARLGRPARPGPMPRPIGAPTPAPTGRRIPSSIAALRDRGVAVDVNAFDVNAGLKSLGEGSYGQVYETTMNTPTTGPIRVVLKRMKPRVANAAAFFDAEHLLNVHAARKARDGVASFYGYVDVPPESAGRQLTAGTWLVWRFEGDRTLAEFLRRRDCESALAEALGLPADAATTPGVVPATILADVLGALAGLHAAGVVHRDVKPGNIILSDVPPGGWPQEDAAGASPSPRRRRPPAPRPRFLLIDLGAAADLRYGTNFDPAESVLDPLYCPPERFVLPSDEAPALADTPGLFASRILSPLVWSRWRPDAFDAYSAGLVLLQAAIPRLRSPAGLRAFNTALARVGGDLEAWRAGARLSAAESAALDAEDGAGWDLAASLLAPRPGMEATPDGGVSFGGGGGGDTGAARPTAAAALRHPFIARLAVPVRSRKAVEEGALAPPSSVKRGEAAAASTSSAAASAAGLLSGTAAAVWRAATKRLFALEGRLLAQTEAVATQTTRVRAAAARAAEASGSADTRAALAAEEAALVAEQAKLDGLTTDFEATAATASEQLAGLLPAGEGGDETAQPPPPPTPSPVAAALTTAAVGGLAGALRWTGTALRVATALATQVADGASRAAEEEAERAAALKVDRDVGLAFVEALRSLNPPPASVASWEADVRPRLARDKRVTRVPAPAAAALYEAWAAARSRAAAAAAAEAERGFAAALAAAAIPHTVPWVDALLVLQEDPATDAARAAGVDVAGLYAGLQATAGAEAAFTDLLAETIPATKRGAPWRALRPSICDDPRFAPIAEMRRRELYATARAAHDAAAAAAEVAAAAAAKEKEAAAAVAAASAAAVGDVFVGEEDEGDDDSSSVSSSPPSPPPPPPSIVDGEALAEEQRRLRAAYEQMEAKLKVMEGLLAAATGGGGVGGGASSVSPVPGAVDVDAGGVEGWVE